MPVDFTKQSHKSNLDYLRDYVAGNEEAIEFLDAVAAEIIDLKDQIKEAEDESNELEDKLDDLEHKFDEEKDYEGDIDTLFGPSESLRWSCQNYDVMELMEALDECIHRNVPIKKISAILRAL